jgi:hypothetical protein
MNARSDDIRLLLLDMLAGDGRADCRTMAGLAPQEWHALAAMARQHRLEPLLHRNLEALPQWTVPGEIRERWRGSFRRTAFRALACERVIGQIARHLDASGVPYAALKGAWLAFHAYPHPALRPLRDIDILVPSDRAKMVFELLLAQGFTPRSASEPSAEHALSRGKHLAGLVSPGDQISVEIHHRLLTPDPQHKGRALAIGDVLRSRIIETSQAGSIAYPAPTEMLLHLIVHAVYEHGFCNGPLVLTDIAYLLGKAEIDWDRFWAMAERGGWSEGCSLLLGLAAQYHDLQVARPVTLAPPPAAVLRMAALMMLQDHAQRGRIELASSLGAAPGLLAKLGIAARRICPDRHALAAFARRRSDGKLPWLIYPAWFLSRMRLAAGVLMAEQSRSDILRARALKSWLGTQK